VLIHEVADNTPEHRAARRRIVDELMDEETRRRHGFDRETAPRGAAGIAAAALRRYNRRSSGLLSADGALPAWAVPCVMTDGVLRLQARLRVLRRKHTHAAVFPLAGGV
jgi:hypothetical protein